MTPTASKRQLGASASAIWTQPAEICHVFILPVLGRAHCCPARCESQPSESRRLLDASAGPWEPICGHSVNLHGLAAGLCAPPRAGSTHCTPRGCPKPTAGFRGRSGFLAPTQPFCLHSPCTGQQTWFRIGIYFCPKFPCLSVALLPAVVAGSDASRISCVQDFPF